MVGKYTRTRQRWLKGRIVKFGHGRHYKKEAFAVYRGHTYIEEERGNTTQNRGDKKPLKKD